MNVKLIAVDMDGTFLNSQSDYNRDYFDTLFQEMRRQGVEFVVASGNQYAQLANFFVPYKSEINFAAENGGNVYVHGKPIYHAKMSNEVKRKVAKILPTFNPGFTVACGFKSAYVVDGLTDEEYKFASFYFPVIRKVSNLAKINDDIIKYSLSFPGSDLEKVANELNSKLNKDLNAILVGGDDIDLVIPGVHKANGIKKIQGRLNISDEEVAAFGDNGNDKEMLIHAKYGFAMGNAREDVKEVADEVIGNNNEDAVLKTIELLLK